MMNVESAGAFKWRAITQRQRFQHSTFIIEHSSFSEAGAS